MSLSRTLSRLKRGRQTFAAAYPSPDLGPDTATSPLQELNGFANPGNLRGLFHAPVRRGEPAPLLVVLHGCTQDAASYDHGSGWSRLANRHGFVVLYPEQRRANNPNLCFNWYQRADAVRDRGEAASIAAMVDALKAQLAIDPDRVFVTGLSAGGAMTSVMLATYPDVFAAGAVIAGMPYACASNLSEAFECMAGRGQGDAQALAARVRAGSGHSGPWPRLSIWHGSADRIVAPSNAEALVKQWTGLHGLGTAPDRVEMIDGHRRRVWLDREGEELIEHFDVQDMAHGTPLMPGTGEGQSGQARAHMLDVGLSSTDRIAAFFGIGPEVTPSGGQITVAADPVSEPAKVERAPEPARYEGSAPSGGSVQQTIEDALRSAGLLR